MNAYGPQLIEGLMRSGLVLTIAACGVWLFLKVSVVSSPSLRRLLWFAVVLQGILLVRIPVTAPSISFLSKSVSRDVSIPNDSQSVFRLPTIAIEVAETLFSVDSAAEGDRNGSGRLFDGWKAILLSVWTIGIAVIIIRGAWYYGKFLRCLSNSSVTPQAWIDEWQSLLDEANVKRRVVLRASPGLGPLLCWHPRGYQLIVPEGVWRLLEPRQRIMIMRHELAHLTRGDIWKSFSLRLLALPHWFNPLVWWVVKQFDEDAERACDDAVRQSDPSLAIDYARTLLLLGGSHGETLFASQAAGSHGLAGRIRRLLVSNSRKDSNMKKLTIVTLVLGLSVLHLLRFQAQAEDRPAEDPAPAAGSINITGRDGIHFSGNGLTIESGQQNGRTEAVVDMAYLFSHLDQFVQQRERLKKEIAEQEVWAKVEMQKLQRTSDKVAARGEFDKKRKEFSQEFLGKEREIYLTTYKSVSAEIKTFAKENGIRVVRRTDRKGGNGIRLAATTAPASLTATIAPASENKPANGTTGVYIFSGNVKTDRNATPGVSFTGAPSNAAEGAVLNVQVANATPTPTLTLVAIDDGKTKPDNVPPQSNVHDLVISADNGFRIGVDHNKSKGLGEGTLLLCEAGSPGIAIGVEAPESFESLMQKEVLFAESGDEYDITKQILNRLNERFQSEQASKKAN